MISLLSTSSRRSLGRGSLIRFESETLAFHASWKLGPIEGLRRFVALHRREPFWMRPWYGNCEAQIPADTQWLLAEFEGGSYALFAPLIDGAFRASLHGGESGLVIHVDSGDPAVVGAAFDALYVIEGSDVHELAEVGAREVAAYFGIPMREDKKTPEFVGDFGWCTWDAFYRGVTPEGVRAGLEALTSGGVQPGFVILDDGWLSTRVGTHREEILTSFSANGAFEGNLEPIISSAKQEFGVRTFLVWHAVNGYWGGADAAEFRAYDVRPVVRRFAEGILAGQESHPWWADGTFQGPVPSGLGITWLVPPSAIAQFYGDFHRSLRAQGVDGLKVDNQAALEGLGEGAGGRIALMQRYREALEGSAHVNFGGNLINCMSCSTDMLYSARASNLVRSSDDFYPNNPETHGRHVVTNSLFGFWFGQFVQPDWDMFHSAHPAGAFHAAARAISGGPIYVSDKPGQHDFVLIKRLILADGRTARTLKPAVPTADSLLANVLAGDAPFKAFAPNASNWIVGAFHCHYGADEITVSGFVSSDDVPELRGKDVIAYADGSIRRLPTPIQLGALEYRLITLAEVVDGFAVIGLVRLLNPGGGVGKVTRDRKCVVVEALAGGELLAYSQLKPRSVEIRSGATWAEIPFQWESEGVRVILPDDAAESQIVFRF